MTNNLVNVLLLLIVAACAPVGVYWWKAAARRSKTVEQLARIAGIKSPAGGPPLSHAALTTKLAAHLQGCRAHALAPQAGAGPAAAAPPAKALPCTSGALPEPAGKHTLPCAFTTGGVWKYDKDGLDRFGTENISPVYTPLDPKCRFKFYPPVQTQRLSADSPIVAPLKNKFILYFGDSNDRGTLRNYLRSVLPAPTEIFDVDAFKPIHSFQYADTKLKLTVIHVFLVGMAIQPLTMYMQGKRGFVFDEHVFNTEPKGPVERIQHFMKWYRNSSRPCITAQGNLTTKAAACVALGNPDLIVLQSSLWDIGTQRLKPKENRKIPTFERIEDGMDKWQNNARATMQELQKTFPGSPMVWRDQPLVPCTGNTCAHSKIFYPQDITAINAMAMVLAKELGVAFPYFGDKCNSRSHIWESFHYEEAEQRLWIAMLLELLNRKA